MKHFLSMISSLMTIIPLKSSANTCESLPITMENLIYSKDAKSPINSLSLEHLPKILTEFEKSFKNDSKGFTNIIHPAIIKTDSDKRALLQSTLDDFGIKGIKLTLSEIFLLNFTNDDLDVKCRGGTARGVVGHKTQIVVFHTASVNTNTFKFITIYVPVLPEHKTSSKFKYDLGLAMIHGYTTSMYSKTYKDFMNESNSWAAKKNLLGRWQFAEASRRLLNSSQPYWSPDELALINNEANQAKKELQESEKFKKFLDALDEKALPKVEDITIVYQSDNVLPGIKIRIPYSTPLTQQTKMCTQITNLFGKSVSTDHRAIECLVYSLSHNISTPPDFGSQLIHLK